MSCPKLHQEALPRPTAGDDAAGYGVSGKVARIAECQPLAKDGIWRVTLDGEGFGRLIRLSSQELGCAGWQLLQLDDMTDEQLDAYEMARLDVPAPDWLKS